MEGGALPQSLTEEGKCQLMYIQLMHALVLSPVQLCDPMDCSLPGSSVHGILQAKILDWVAISFSRVFSRHRDQAWVSCIADNFSAV